MAGAAGAEGGTLAAYPQPGADALPGTLAVDQIRNLIAGKRARATVKESVRRQLVSELAPYGLDTINIDALPKITERCRRSRAKQPEPGIPR